MLGLESITQSTIRVIILAFCCVAEALLLCAAFYVPLWEIPGTKGYLDSGPLKETYLSSSLERSRLEGFPLLLSVFVGLSAGLAVPLLHFFGVDLMKWGYSKISPVEFGSEFIAAKLRDALLGQCIASLMSSMFTAAVLIWILKEKEESYARGFYCIVGTCSLTLATTVLRWYLPQAPADSGQEADETQNIWGADVEDAAEDSPEDYDNEKGSERGWWRKKTARKHRDTADSDSNDNESVDGRSSHDSEEQPKRGWLW